MRLRAAQYMLITHHAINFVVFIVGVFLRFSRCDCSKSPNSEHTVLWHTHRFSMSYIRIHFLNGLNKALRACRNSEPRENYCYAQRDSPPHSQYSTKHNYIHAIDQYSSTFHDSGFK